MNSDGKRSHLPPLTGRADVTCRYRRGDQCSAQPPYGSANPYFGDLLTAALDRRGLFRAGAVLALAGGTAAAAAPPTARLRPDFEPVEPNSERGTRDRAPADEANPRNVNKHGQVLELTESAGAAGASLSWNLLLVCRGPGLPGTYLGGSDKSRDSPISCPDNLAFDRYGNLWITTGSGAAPGANDGLYAVPLEGPGRGHLEQFLSFPRGAEACGPAITDQLVTVCVQHSGGIDGADAEHPASHWPDGGDANPLPSVVAFRKSCRRG